MRSLAFVFSQFIWLILFRVFLYVSKQFPNYERFSISPAPVINKWNSTLDPIVYTHDTDVHINRHDPNSTIAFRKTLETAEMFHPIVHFLTGDLSDDYKRLTHPKYSDQDEEAWSEYKDVLDNAEYTYPVLETAGNHDMWGVKEVGSKRFYLLDYSKTYSRDDIKTDEDFFVRINTSFPHHNLIVVNPFRFPTGHSTLLYYPEPYIQLLDQIEKAVEETPSAIFLCHYPPDMWRKVKSSTGKSITDIINNPNIELIVTGHTHPSIPKIRHHGIGVLEMTGVGGMDHDIFGVITEDNGRFSYHAIYVENPKKGIVTHPITLNETNYHTAFAEKNTEIRLLLTEPYKKVNIEGDIVGNMSYIRRTKNGLYLYTHPLDLKEPGTYTIYFSGDFEEELTFIYGDTTYEIAKEPWRSSPKVTYCDIYYIIPLYIMLQYILFPVKIFNYQKLEDWIEGKDEGPWWNWFLSIFCGFIAVRSRILNSPLFMRILLYIALCWPLALPASLMEIDGKLGFIFTYGFVCGHYQFSTDGPAYTLMFLNYIIIPMIIFISGFGTGIWLIWTFVIDCAVAAGIFAVGMHDTLINRLSETVGDVYMYISFHFTWIPIVLFVGIIVMIIQTCRHPPERENPFLLNQVLISSSEK